MSNTVRIGLSANAGGAHTRELLQAFPVARDWLEIDAAFVWAEDGRDPALAASAATQLCDAGVPIVVGHLSAAAAVSALPVYARRDVAFIAPATSHPRLNPTGWAGAVRTSGSDKRTARSMLSATPPSGQPVICFQRQAYGEALAAELDEALTASGLNPSLIAIDGTGDEVELPPDTGSLYVAGIHEFCAEVIRTVRKQGVTSEIAVGDDCFTKDFVSRCGEAVEGCTVSTQIVPRAIAGSFGEACAASGYFPTCLIAISVALQASRQFPELRGEELGKAIRAMRWRTPFGGVKFDSDGDLKGLLDMNFKVKGGAFEQLVTSTARGRLQAALC